MLKHKWGCASSWPDGGSSKRTNLLRNEKDGKCLPAYWLKDEYKKWQVVANAAVAKAKFQLVDWEILYAK